jgi:V/A-type H+/Na+-transporting ATPase subunit E
MALDNVTKEIATSADKTASDLKSEADKEVEAIKVQADATIADMKEREDKRLKDAIEQLGRQETSSAELESKKIVLAKKKEILEDAFESALKGLESAPASKKLEQYKKMIASAKTVIDKPTVLISESDKFTARELGVNSVKADPRIHGGIVLQSEDGSIEVDMQYSTLLQTIWDHNIKAVSDILFG